MSYNGSVVDVEVFVTNSKSLILHGFHPLRCRTHWFNKGCRQCVTVLTCSPCSVCVCCDDKWLVATLDQTWIFSTQVVVLLLKILYHEREYNFSPKNNNGSLACKELTILKYFLKGNMLEIVMWEIFFPEMSVCRNVIRSSLIWPASTPALHPGHQLEQWVAQGESLLCPANIHPSQPISTDINPSQRKITSWSDLLAEAIITAKLG